MVDLKNEPSAPSSTVPPESIKHPIITSEDDEYDRFNLSTEITQAMIDAADELERDYNTYKEAQLRVPLSRDRLGKVLAAFDELWKQEQGDTTKAPEPSYSPSSTPIAAPSTPKKSVARSDGAQNEGHRTDGQSVDHTTWAPTSTPTTSHTVSLPHTPKKSPCRGSAPPPKTPLSSYVPFPAATPGKTVRLSDFRPKPTPPLSVTKAYVVYVGENGGNGIYDNLEDAYAVCGEDNKHSLMKRFPSVELAAKCYDDCVEYDLFKVLVQPWAVNEHFVVIAGVAPGVYTGRGQLMKIGLRWRGGEVVRVLGTWAEANAYFSRQEELGCVQSLKSFVPDDF